MDVKEAVRTATDFVADVFDSEQIEHLALEELEFEPEINEWRITVGFSRPWDHPRGAFASLSSEGPSRSYKIVRISADSGEVLSVKDRRLE